MQQLYGTEKVITICYKQSDTCQHLILSMRSDHHLISISPALFPSALTLPGKGRKVTTKRNSLFTANVHRLYDDGRKMTDAASGMTSIKL